jgi:ATP-dependent DNA helicase RecG
MSESRLKEPVFTSDSFFHVVFYKNSEYALKGDISKDSQKSSRKIIEMVGQNSGVTIEDLANSIGISPGAIKKNIQKLNKKGILKRVGPDKGGHWEVVNQGKNGANLEVRQEKRRYSCW